MPVWDKWEEEEVREASANGRGLTPVEVLGERGNLGQKSLMLFALLCKFWPIQWELPNAGRPTEEDCPGSLGLVQTQC